MHPECCGLDLRSDDAFRLGERSFECPLCLAAEYARAKKVRDVAHTRTRATSASTSNNNNNNNNNNYSNSSSNSSGSGGGGYTSGVSAGGRRGKNCKREISAAAKYGIVPDAELPLALFRVGSRRVPVSISKTEFLAILDLSSSSTTTTTSSSSPPPPSPSREEEMWEAFDSMRRALGCYLGGGGGGGGGGEKRDEAPREGGGGERDRRGGGETRLARRVAVNTQRQVKFLSLINSVLERGALDEGSGALSRGGVKAYKDLLMSLQAEQQAMAAVHDARAKESSFLSVSLSLSLSLSLSHRI